VAKEFIVVWDYNADLTCPKADFSDVRATNSVKALERDEFRLDQRH
jgi:hypothetical protein